METNEQTGEPIVKEYYRYLQLLLILLVVNLSLPQATAQEKNKKPVQNSENAKQLLSGTSPEEQEYAARKYQFIREALSRLVDTTANGSLSFELATDQQKLPFFLDAEGLQGLNPDGIFPHDDIPQAHNPDIPPTISLNKAIESMVELFKKGAKKARYSKLPVPSDLEIDVLKVLWVENNATSSEIYAKLDTSSLIFAEELQHLLKNMVNRGFLDRKKISPSHELSLFGLAKIELSAKNRKNKLYLYWPIVTKEGLQTYLDAKRYLALIDAREENNRLNKSSYEESYQKYLEKKLYRMFK